MKTLPDFDYVLTSLPRCGNGWLSALLSYGTQSTCYAEAYARYLARGEVPVQPKGGVLGNADPMYLLCPDDIACKKVVLVARDEHQVASSMKKASMDIALLGKAVEGARQLIDAERIGLFIRYEDLMVGPSIRREYTAKRLWEYVLPDVPWDSAHWFRMNTLHVNPRSIT